MYRVEWNDHEGNLQQMDFKTAEEAMLETKALKAKYDYVEWGIVEQLFSVSLADKRDRDSKIKLRVWAENVDKATHSLCGSLIGAYSEYEWVGTGPIYQNNQVVTRISGRMK